MSDIREAIQTVVDGRDLSMQEAASAMMQIMEGKATPAQFGAFVTALRMKGETPEEIAGMARVMREKSLHVDCHAPVVDTCGTGGDGKNTFNISTAAAFVVAGAGLPVAKHGNRAASSASGSADVLEHLGVKIDLQPDAVKRCLDEIGICFMFAQTFHPAMRYAGPPRREIGIRTVFNILGPLTNPAGVTRQVIGVGDPSLALKMARALALLGSEHVLIVHGQDGTDEISVAGNTDVWEVVDGRVKKSRARPADFGVPDGSPDHLQVSSVDESADIVRAVLDGKGGGHNAPASVERSARTSVVINAGAALVAGDKAGSFHEGAAMAIEAIDSGAAATKLNDLAALSQTLR